jgi:adenylate cyclase, class 2
MTDMNTTGTEIETKFLVENLNKVESRLQDLGARLVQSRILENNLRFDLPDATLRKSYRVLRLRQDERAILTFKGPGTMVDGVRSREEWEVALSDFAIMQKILESLGYVIEFTYEKYRTTYEINSAHVMLDEMPLGNFVEIEGDSKDSIASLAIRLHLDFSAAIQESYQTLFEHAKKSIDLKFRDLTFQNFAGLLVKPASLGVKLADQE